MVSWQKYGTGAPRDLTLLSPPGPVAQHCTPTLPVSFLPKHLSLVLQGSGPRWLSGHLCAGGKPPSGCAERPAGGARPGALRARCAPGGLEGAEVTSGQWWPPAVPRPLHATLATRAPGEGTGGGASCLPSSGTATICCSARSLRVPRCTQLHAGHHGGAGTRWVVAGRPGGLLLRCTETLPSVPNFTPGQTRTSYADRTPRPRAPSGSRWHPLPNSDFVVLDKVFI